jgi:hypothetical protein
MAVRMSLGMSLECKGEAHRRHKNG